MRKPYISTETEMIDSMSVRGQMKTVGGALLILFIFWSSLLTSLSVSVFISSSLIRLSSLWKCLLSNGHLLRSRSRRVAFQTF